MQYVKAFAACFSNMINNFYFVSSLSPLVLLV